MGSDLDGLLPKSVIRILTSRRHSGFHVFCGNRISPDDETAMENLARYIISPEGHTRTSFSYPEGHKQERMQYLDQEEKSSIRPSQARSSLLWCEATDFRDNSTTGITPAIKHDH